MDWAGTTRHHQGKLAWVEPAPHRDHTDRCRLVRVGQAVDGVGGGDDVEAQRIGNLLLDHPVSCSGVELDTAAMKIIGIEIAEQEIGIGGGRLIPAVAVTSWTGIGAGAVRTYPQDAARIDSRGFITVRSTATTTS